MYKPALSFALALAGTTVAAPHFAGATGSGVIVVGLTADQRLVSFREREPEDLDKIGTVTGLGGADTKLIGIDYRVQDGLLYGVGDGGGVYVLDTDNANATLVSQLTIALEGSSFGVDFNPAADRLRIVSNAGQNLRHNVNAGGTTTLDTPLSYAAGVTATGVAAAAYTNNDLDPSTGTTLFDIDVALDQVVIQSPANSGMLVATGLLGTDAAAVAGLDIFSSSFPNSSNRALAALTVGGKSKLYRIKVLTGRASSVGRFERPVIDLAVPLGQ
jgi:hypothetical protein